jgi:ferritin
MTDEKYNGWTNYETWLMNLVLTNEQSLYNTITELVEQYNPLDDYDLGDRLKEYIEENFTEPNTDDQIIHVDCERWTLRDFQEINWTEIATSFREK